MSKKVKEVIALLEADGWEHKRTRGDHRIFMKAGAARPIVVPGALNHSMPEGTYQSEVQDSKSKITMNKLQVIIERAEDNYSAYIEGIDGVVATGESIDEIKTNMLEAIGIFVEECREFGCEVPEALQGEYEVNFKMDVSTLMAFYSGIFSKAGLERLTGINQKQLWHYANGSSRPRPEQRQRIETALHQLGHELISVAL